MADIKGFTYSREDVDARSLANAYAQTLGNVFTHEMKPMEVEILVAEVGVDRAGDQLFHIPYDGTVVDEDGLHRPRRRRRHHRRAPARPTSPTTSTSAVRCGPRSPLSPGPSAVLGGRRPRGGRPAPVTTAGPGLPRLPESELTAAC